MDYLQQHKIPTVVMLMPEGTWESKIPFDQEFNDQVLEVCRSRGVRVYDFRRLLDDEDFTDSTHPAAAGAEKLDAAVLPFCLDHLRSTGLLIESVAP